MEGFLILLAVAFGYYLGNRVKTIQEVSKAVKKVKKKFEKPYGEPFIVEPDEGGIEREEQRKKEEEENDISLEGAIKAIEKNE